VSFVWGGDVAGQGWGINPDDGGMFTFATMKKHRPDFFLHSGDTIYADGPIQSEVKLPDNKVWKNLTVQEKAKVAETLDDSAPPQIQFSRRERAWLQCRSADLRPVGRP
jgi:alkaline phosphatase D